MPFKFVTIEQLRRHSGLTAGTTTEDATITDFASAYEEEILRRVPRYREYAFGTGLFAAGETHSLGLDEEDDSIVVRHYPIRGPATVTDLFANSVLNADTFFVEHREGMITTTTSRNWPVGKNRYFVTYQGIAGETPADLSLLVLRGVSDEFRTKGFPSSVRKYRVDNIEIENNPQSKQSAFFTDAQMKIINRHNDPFRGCTASF